MCIDCHHLTLKRWIKPVNPGHQLSVSTGEFGDTNQNQESLRSCFAVCASHVPICLTQSRKPKPPQSRSAQYSLIDNANSREFPGRDTKQEVPEMSSAAFRISRD